MGTGKIVSVRNFVVSPYTVQIFPFLAASSCTLPFPLFHQVEEEPEPEPVKEEEADDEEEVKAEGDEDLVEGEGGDKAADHDEL